MVALAILVIIGVVVWLVLRRLLSPAIGSVSQEPLSSPEAVVPYSQPGFYRGQYISFDYPAFYKKDPSELTGDFLEVVDLSSTDRTSKQLSIGVTKESLNDDSGVRFREMHPKAYHLVTRTFDSLTYDSNLKVERLIYVQLHVYVINISCISLSNLAINNDCQTVADSLKLR